MDYKIGILTVSDRCAAGTQEDVSGKILAQAIHKDFHTNKINCMIVEDDINSIKNVLVDWISQDLDVVFTTGGTGFSSRDVTPEATRLVIEKEAPGISYAMLSKSLAVTDMAMLSRAVCGISKKTLIINLPGSAKGASECYEFIKKTLPHAVDLLRDKRDLIQQHHYSLQNQCTPSKVQVNNVASRNRKSPYPMLEVSDAIDLILKECHPSTETEEISFDESLGRVLAEDVYATEPVPPFRASIKDGYAVRCQDGITNRSVRNVVAAGDEPCEEILKEGEAIRISTGASIPPGADAVVQVEDTNVIETTSDERDEAVISIEKAPKVGQDIREVGSDVAVNSLVLKRYDQITAAHVGVLAMLGKTTIKVFKRPTVGILSTGNEVKDPQDERKPGQIRDSNKFTLMSLMKKYGVDAVDCGVARDEPNAVKWALQKAFSKLDVVVSTGGVSMGEFDVLKQVLVEDFGATIHFARVNMKPGKPTTFATLVYEGKIKRIFGLPGNPVSCNVTSILFVIPAIRYMEENKNYRFPVVQVEITDMPNKDPRPEYHRVDVRVDISGKFTAISTGNQISSRLNSMVGANGLALVPGSQNLQDLYELSALINRSVKYDTIIFDDIGRMDG